MKHPDDATLQRLFDGDLPEADRVEAERHLATCGRCDGVMRALGALHDQFTRWDDALPAPSDAFADAVFAKLETPSAKVIPLARPAVERRSFSVRRVAFPAIAVAAAALLALRFAPPVTDEHRGTVVARTSDPPPSVTPPVEVGHGNDPGGAEVTRVDVRGAQSYAVLELPGISPGATTAVVWIQDLADDAPPPSAPQ